VALIPSLTRRDADTQDPAERVTVAEQTATTSGVRGCRISKATSMNSGQRMAPLSRTGPTRPSVESPVRQSARRYSGSAILLFGILPWLSVRIRASMPSSRSRPATRPRRSSALLRVAGTFTHCSMFDTSLAVRGPSRDWRSSTWLPQRGMAGPISGPRPWGDCPLLPDRDRDLWLPGLRAGLSWLGSRAKSVESRIPTRVLP